MFESLLDTFAARQNAMAIPEGAPKVAFRAQFGRTPRVLSAACVRTPTKLGARLVPHNSDEIAADRKAQPISFMKGGIAVGTAAN